MRTQVAIIGAGPAGLLLSHLLHLNGIESVVIEAKSRDHVENRIRAGVLEQGTVDVLIDAGVGDRLRREGLVHKSIMLRYGERTHELNVADLTNGRAVTVYGQQEVVRDLIAARLAAGGTIFFEADARALEDLETKRPRVRFGHEGREIVLDCDVVAACDGFHGIGRSAIPEAVRRTHERVYPFGWLGILAEAPPASDVVIYSSHERGFALLSMRSPSISRLYIQCDPAEDPIAWSDEAIWDELETRLSDGNGFRLTRGPVLQKGVTPMRSFVSEPMRWHRLFLAGDAAHIVPPTGAKGMNLAISDVWYLARALESLLKYNKNDLVDTYSATCLSRIWKVQRFSWWVTSMMHRYPKADSFDRHMQLAQLEYLAASRAAAETFAENYTGLPLC